MEIINTFLNWIMKKRIHQIELFLKYPIEVQEDVMRRISKEAKDTAYGKEYYFKDIRSVSDFKEQIPVSSYETLFPYIEKMLRGEKNVLWPSEIKWFAKSSGTTNARSKFIPVSQSTLDDCHYKGGKDLIAIYANNYPDSKIFTGKSLVIGGSHQINKLNKSSQSYFGDVSAVIMQNLPIWAQLQKVPKLEIALMDEWESKLQLMADTCADENVTSIFGVPTWTLVLIEKILKQKGKDSLLDIWPNLELFVHGAVAFGPYRDIFKQLIPSSKMRYLETYNASEGFFGIQDQKNSDEMLLMLDYGIYYEFIPMDEVHKEHPKTLSLAEVELGKNYAIVISTNSGLWRYKVGDTVKFTSLYPFRIKISGRTKHFINAFGEEVIVENAEQALTQACKRTDAIVSNFTAGPKYLEKGKQGAHEWIIEFDKAPNDQNEFSKVLDETLRNINSDYDAKRYKDIALRAPIVHTANKGTFYMWMKKRGKLGGQHKVPRLANNREYIDTILPLL